MDLESSLEASGTRHLPIEEMELYRLFEEVSDWCWESVDTWSPKAQRAMGNQLITSADSICANFVEGDGRWGVKDGVNFFTIARASAPETRMWVRKAIKRRCVEPRDGEAQIAKLTTATRLLNNLIRYRRTRGAFSAVKESSISYDSDPLSEAL